MNKNHTVFLFLFTLIVHLAHGMENNSPKYLTSNAPGEYEKIIENPLYHFFYGSSYATTHKSLIEGLKKREKDGAYVEFKSGIHTSNIFPTLKNITFDNNHHNKGLIACEKDPSLGSPGKNVIIETSANWTYNAYRNNERGFRIFDNKDLFLQALAAYHSKPQSEEEKTISSITPQKFTLLSSKNIQLNQTEICRTETATKQASIKSNNCEIIKSSMNYSYPSSGQSLINFVKQGGTAHLIVNETALRGSKELLTEMNQEGVKVHISKEMNHAKLFVRHINGNYYSAIGTGNTTIEGDREINTSLETTDPLLGKIIMQEQKEYIEKNTISLAQAEENEALKKTKKRKFNDAGKKTKTKTKKQKLKK